VPGWVTVYSPNNIASLRRPKNVKFGTKVASSTRMMRTLRFLKKVFKLWQNRRFWHIFGGFLQNANFLQKHLHSGATYTQEQRIRGTTVRVDSSHATSDSAKH